MRPSRRELLLAAGSALASSVVPARLAAAAEPQLAGRSLSRLRDDHREELFDRVLPFWERHGVDHEHGGFMCALDYDGTPRHTQKFHWYQGRGIWVYSRLYNEFGKHARHLELHNGHNPGC